MKQNEKQMIGSSERKASAELVEMTNVIMRLRTLMEKLGGEEKATAKRMLDSVLKEI